MPKNKQILVLDFDGVIHSYTSGWKGADIVPDEPVQGAIEAIIKYSDKFNLHILSARSSQSGGIDAMKQWLYNNLQIYFDNNYRTKVEIDALSKSILSSINWPTEKPPALVTIDDRAIQFTGTWPSVDELTNFKPWNLKSIGARNAEK